MNRQLTLTIQLKHHASLQDFQWHPHNLLLKHALENIGTPHGDRMIYLWGGPGVGKTHLLQGMTQIFYERHQTAMYLPMQELVQCDPHCLSDISADLVAVDDIELIAGIPAWEEAFFHFYNRIKDNEQCFMIANECTPTISRIRLPDLRSRLSWGLVVELKELDDEHKVLTLQQQAEERGFHLPDSVALFLIKRCGRNMHELQKMLERLDHASLAAQRKITIPFVKHILEI